MFRGLGFKGLGCKWRLRLGLRVSVDQGFFPLDVPMAAHGNDDPPSLKKPTLPLQGPTIISKREYLEGR